MTITANGILWNETAGDLDTMCVYRQFKVSTNSRSVLQFLLNSVNGYVYHNGYTEIEKV